MTRCLTAHAFGLAALTQSRFAVNAAEWRDNRVFTIDYRRVYASVIEGWLSYRDTRKLHSGNF